MRDVLPHLESDAPIVASVAEALQFAPTALLIGTAPKGGGLPPEWRAAVLEAIAAKLEIVSGLHDMLDEDREFHVAALAAGTTIWDVREPPEVPLFSGDVYDVAGADRADGRQRLRGRQDERRARARARGERAPERTRASFRPVRPAS